MADALAAESLRAWLRILFARTMRLHTQQRPVVELSARARLVREFHLAVEAHFREERTLEIYARELGVSANHLNDVIRWETKRSAGGIIRQRRLLDAKRLLSHSELSVSEIGYRLGFHPSYFGRFFRKGTGSSPAAFREEIRGEMPYKGPLVPFREVESRRMKFDAGGYASYRHARRSSLQSGIFGAANGHRCAAGH
jgi:AraC-like DNA-binding protein